MEQFIQEQKSALITIIILSVSLFFYFGIRQQSTLSLQSKCSEGSEKFFKDNAYASDDTGNQYTYTSHYNKSLDKCFILIKPTYNSLYSSKTFINTLLIDVFESKEYADFATIQGKIIYCIINEQTSNQDSCKSEVEFNNFIDFYLSK